MEFLVADFSTSGNYIACDPCVLLAIIKIVDFTDVPSAPNNPSTSMLYNSKNPWSWDKTVISHDVVQALEFHEANG